MRSRIDRTEDGAPAFGGRIPGGEQHRVFLSVWRGELRLPCDVVAVRPAYVVRNARSRPRICRRCASSPPERPVAAYTQVVVAAPDRDLAFRRASSSEALRSLHGAPSHESRVSMTEVKSWRWPLRGMWRRGPIPAARGRARHVHSYPVRRGLLVTGRRRRRSRISDWPRRAADRPEGTERGLFRSAPASHDFDPDGHLPRDRLGQRSELVLRLEAAAMFVRGHAQRTRPPTSPFEFVVPTRVVRHLAPNAPQGHHQGLTPARPSTSSAPRES